MQIDFVIYKRSHLDCNELDNTAVDQLFNSRK